MKLRTIADSVRHSTAVSKIESSGCPALEPLRRVTDRAHGDEQ